MSEIKVTSQELRNKANDLKGYIGKFESERQNLITAEKALMSTFEGDAANEFNRNFTTFDSQMANFKQVVDDYVVKLESMAEAYERSEVQAAQAAGQK